MRRWGVWAALLLTLLACWWLEQAEQADQAAPAHAMRTHQPLAAVTGLRARPVPALVLPTQPAPVAITAAVDRPAVNLFAAMPVAGMVDMHEAVPEPAVNPYTYAGRLNEGGRWTVFLTDGQQQYVLHAGEHFADGWWVVALTEQVLVLQHAAAQFEIRLDNGVMF